MLGCSLDLDHYGERKTYLDAEIIFEGLDGHKIQARNDYTLDLRNTLMESKDSFNLNEKEASH